MKKRVLIVTAIVVALLIIDQLIKIYVKSSYTPGVTHPVLGDWFVMEYIENQGMAFGTRFGSSIWSKLFLSLFRIAAIIGICIYLSKQLRKSVRIEFLIAVSLVLAGATGNLIDSMFYDYIFPVDQYLDCYQEYNRLAGSGNFAECGVWGEVELRHTGFLFGNVVDMFKFQANWPESFPWVGGKEVFPAIWNFADACITVGIILIFFRQRKYFPKENKTA